MGDQDTGEVDLTVVIPFYNSADVLPRALASVLQQTVAPREILVVDDASTEPQRLRAMALLAEVPHARLIVLDQNGGAGEARNVGWNAARGKWIAFLDSDDAWHRQKLECQLDAVGRASPEPVLIGSRWQQVTTVDALAAQAIPKEPELLTLTKRAFLLRNRVSTPSVMVRRDIQVRFPQGRRYCEDYEAWLMVAALGEPMVRVEVPLVGLFKAVYGDSGLSASIFRMIGGEYRAFLGARRARSISAGEALIGLAAVTVRGGGRLVRLALRRLGSPLRKGSVHG